MHRIKLISIAAVLLGAGGGCQDETAQQPAAAPDAAAALSSEAPDQREDASSEPPAAATPNQPDIIDATEESQAFEQPGLPVAAEAPDFALRDQQGETQALSQLLEKGPVALVFYRSADW